MSALFVLTRWRRRTIHSLTALALMAHFLGGCAAHRLYNEDSLDYIQQIQVPDLEGVEFDLAIIEFDDHGVLWKLDQLEEALDLIKRRNAEAERGVFVIPFVHGWQSNADPRQRNDNLVKFREGDNVMGSDGSVVEHISFSVADIDATAKALGEDGATVAGANRRKPGTRHVTDPEGTKIQLIDDEDLRGFHHVYLKSQLPQTTLEWYASVFGGEIANYKEAVNLKAIRYDDMYVFVKRGVRAPASSKGRSVGMRK